MAEFGTLNFQVALKPTSAFPLDARCYFTSLEAAQAAAATAEQVGSTNTLYYYGQKILVYENEQATWYTIQPNGTEPGGILVEDGRRSDTENTVSLLVEGMSVNLAVDNVTEVEGSDESEDLALEIK